MVIFPVLCEAGPLPPEMVDGGVLFQFEDPVAEEVAVAGEFNQWNAKSLTMTREIDNKFAVVVPLAEGKYKYKYVVDGAWMSGEDLTVSIIRREGRLYIYPRQPYLRFPFTSKVDFDGYYLFLAALTDDVDGPGGKMRSETPRNDIDLNFDIHPTDILRAWAQLNVNTKEGDADRVKMDEAFLELKLGNFTVKPFETHWNISFDDPFRMLDAHAPYVDDAVYLSDADRPFYYQYGRYARGFSADVKAGPWLGQMFFSNKVRLDQTALDEDLWGFRVKRGGRVMSLGFSFTQWQIPNGIKASEGTFTNEVLTHKDIGPTSIEYPVGHGAYYHSDLVAQIKPGGPNKKIQTGFDVSLALGSSKLLMEFVSTQNEAAAIAYTNGSGSQRRVYGNAYGYGDGGTHASAERVLGEQSDGFSFLIGWIYRGRSWANEFNVRSHNYRAKFFSGDTLAYYTDTGIKNISPDWIEFIHRLQLNRIDDPSWGLDLESRFVNRSSMSKVSNLFYRERIGSGAFFYAEVPWAKTTIAERINFHWRWSRRMTFSTRLHWMSLDRYGKEFDRSDIQTMEAMPRLNWKWSDKWQMDIGARHASADFGTINKTKVQSAFTKPFAGLKYEWSKLFHIRLWFGLDPYIDEDKKLGARWRVQELFEPVSESVASSNQDEGIGASLANTILETERRFDRDSTIALQAEMRF